MTRKHLLPSIESAARSSDANGTVSLVSEDGSHHKRLKPEAIVNEQLRPQQRYVRRPKHPGMGAFDGALRPLPPQRSKAQKQNSTLAPRPSSHTPTTALAPDHPLYDYADQLRILDECCKRSWERAVGPRKAYEVRTQQRVAFAVNDLSQGISSRPLPSFDNVMEYLPKTVVQVSEHDSVIDKYQSMMMPQAIKDLRLQVKLIYSDLIDLNEVAATPTTSASEQPPDYDVSKWQTLHGLRHALLQPTHDFFLISQDEDVPAALRWLAARYGMSRDSVRHDMNLLVQYLRQATPKYQEETLALVSRAKVFLDTFDRDLSSSGENWASINDNLHCYLHALIDNEFLGVQCMYQCQFDTNSTRWRRLQGFEKSPGDPLDRGLRERYFQQYLSLSLQPTTEEIEERYRAIDVPLKDSVLYFMAGWLSWGSVMAADFHEFCKVFKFLAWVGATF